VPEGVALTTVDDPRCAISSERDRDSQSWLDTTRSRWHRPWRRQSNIETGRKQGTCHCTLSPGTPRLNHTVRSRCAKLPVVVVAQLISSCENMAMKLEPRLPFNGWKSSPRGPAPGGPFGASRPGVRISPACSSSRLSRPSRRVEASHISLTLPWREKPHHYCVRPSSCLISC